MSVEELIENLTWLRNDIIGRNMMFKTPFGDKPLVYADYTASGRALLSIEKYMQNILQYYANTHTEDDFTGKVMTELLHKSEKIIKKAVNAKENGKIIFYGSGTTGSITKLQQILGIYLPPATREYLNSLFDKYEKEIPQDGSFKMNLFNFHNKNKPVVFVGPYEHHSNEIMWRESLCDTIEIPLGKDGYFDLNELEKIISDPKYSNRKKIGSFSASSNVTGILTPVYDVAKILHKYDAIACFDFAACGPYVEINMNKDDESYFDAIFLSPHKFLGGPGTSGILVFNKNLYQKSLPPTVAGGGTVDYVSSFDIEYTHDIETREKPGTPGIIQDIKISLLFQLKEKIGLKNIETIEGYYLKRFYNHFKDNKNIIFYGPIDPHKKIPIIPFNIKDNDKLLHPRFVTKLLNDLFGIQTRAGCSCAGPYGHTLLKIDERASRYYRCLIGVDHFNAIKPGWVRLNLHYSMSETEYQYIVSALEFVIEYGYKFLPLYKVNFISGDWSHMEDNTTNPIKLDIEQTFPIKDFDDLENSEAEKYKNAIAEAKSLLNKLPEKIIDKKPHPALGELVFFRFVNSINEVPSFENDQNNV